MRAWIFQDTKQKQKHGAAACPWSVGWYDPHGKRKSRKIGSKSKAEKFCRRIEGELAAGTYRTTNKKLWADFRKEYETRVVSTMRPTSHQLTLQVLDEFERLMKPVQVASIKPAMIAEFAIRRQTKRVAKKKPELSPATINRDLRHLKAALNVAAEWGYIEPVKVKLRREPKRLKTYVNPEDFAKLYGACARMTEPARLGHVDAGDWWRGLLIFAYMTDWRIREILALRWSDVDLEVGQAITRADDNKGGRDEAVALHPLVVEHLRRLRAFGPTVFPWSIRERALWLEFQKLQQAAGVATKYGFHDFRRAFATLNADRVSGEALQHLMRHKAYSTTQRYIADAEQRGRKAVGSLFVPSLTPKPATG